MIAFFYDLICLLPFSLIPSVWAASVIDPEASKLLLLLLSALLPLLGIIFTHLKGSGRLILGGSFLTTIVLTLLLVPKETRNDFFTEHPSFLPALLISFAVFLAGRFLLNIRAAKLLLSAVLILSLGISLFLNASPDRIVTALSFFFLLGVIVDEVRYRWEKRKEEDHRPHLVYLSPFLLMIPLVLMVFPAPDHPYDWAFAKKIYEAVSDRADRIAEYISSRSGSGKDDEFMGFSDQALLGKKIKGNDRKVLEVTYDMGIVSPVLLNGKTFDAFNGRSWEKTCEDTENDALLDSLETLSSVISYAGDSSADYYRYSSITVRFLSLHSAHAFAPLKSSKITVGKTPETLISSGGDLYFDKKKRPDDRYRVEYYRLNTGNPAFSDFLESSHPQDPEAFSAALRTIGPDAGDAPSYEDLASYRERIREVYLPPTECSPKTRAFLDELLSDCKTDAEKLSRIEKMLSSMKYSTTPGALPSSVNSNERFLDWFLFEKQEGYCVSYATAFVLLARAEGIPARFVQGYRVQPIDPGPVTVTESASHAWPECYIEGAGWIAYEPTPGYKTVQSWKTSGELASEKEESRARYLEAEEGTEPLLPEMEEPEEEQEGGFDPKYPVLILTVSAAVALVLFLVSLLLRDLRYKNAENEKKFRIMFRKNIGLLGILGLKRLESETFEEFRIRCEKEMPPAYLDFLPVFESLLYRGKEAGDADVLVMEDGNRHLRDHIRTTGLINRLRLLISVYFGA